MKQSIRKAEIRTEQHEVGDPNLEEAPAKRRPQRHFVAGDQMDSDGRRQAGLVELEQEAGANSCWGTKTWTEEGGASNAAPFSPAQRKINDLRDRVQAREAASMARSRQAE